MNDYSKWCGDCGKDVKTFSTDQVDCNSCIGTGIGPDHESNSCGVCGGRGYMIIETFESCSECGAWIEG